MPLRAGVPARLVAYLVDLFLVGVATLALWALVDRVPGFRPAPLNEPGRGQDAVSLARLLVGDLLLGGYFVALWSGGRRTIGMRLMRLRVVRAADAGPVTIGAATLRWIVLAVPAVVLDVLVRARPDWFGSSLLLLGLALFGWPLALGLSVVLDPGRHGLHDRAAGTSVITSVSEPSAIRSVATPS